MRRHESARELSARQVFVSILFAVFALPLFPLTLDDAVNAALDHDATLADAKSKLIIAKNSYVKSLPIYGSSLSFSGGENVSGSASQKTMSASLAVPIEKWLSVGVTGTGARNDSPNSSGYSSSSGSVSVSFTPFAADDPSAKASWDKALIEAQGAVRTTILSARREYRAVLTAQAEVAYEKAAVQTAQNELSRIQYLVELGKERKSEELTAYSSLMDVQADLDTAEDNLTTASQNLALRTGIPEAELVLLESPPLVEGRTLVDENEWSASSADMATARIALESVRAAQKSSATMPDFTLGSSVNNSLDWSVSAKVSLSPDAVFQKTASTARENLSIQERSFATTDRTVRSAWQVQRNAITKALHNYDNASRFIETAQTTYTETELLLQKGDASRAKLDSANENLLSAKYQMQKAVESLENARDQLDVAWQVSVR